MISRRDALLNDLRIFLSITIALIIIGTLFIYSASSIYALETFGSSHYFVKKQIYGLLLGIIGCCVARFFPVSFLYRFAPYYIGLIMCLTALTVASPFAVRIHGSGRWLSCAGFSFQPSELLKIGMLLYISYFLSRRTRMKHWTQYIPFLIICGISGIILLKQPDFGLTVTLMSTIILLLFSAQYNVKYLALAIGILTPITGLLIMMRSYRLQRILTFLNPWLDPQGRGFQIVQSLIAIGSGNWIGTGIAHSKQKFFYLPMQHTDFIFSIIAEETGFIGCLFLITLFILFSYFGIRIARQLQNPFASCAVLGFIIITTLQAYINMAVACGIVPTKGIGLPFVSYGNTALVCNLAMIGLIINFVHENRRHLS